MRIFVLTMVVMVVLVVSGYSLQGRAVTRGQFVGTRGIVRILPKDYSGVMDSDGQSLYEAMKVPPRDSIIGPGKSIQTEDKALQFICANRSQSGYECTVFIHSQGAGQVDPRGKTMRYRLTGEKADEYGKLFKVNAQGVFYFLSTEGSFKVDIQPGLFEILYSETSARAQAGEPLVIVNVEDTLKLVHARNFWDSLNYAADQKRRFLGMEEALNLLAETHPGIRFVYLSQSPELAAGKVEENFLKRNGFPKGEKEIYNSNFDKDTRFKILRGIMEASHPSQVFLLSHNGSLDVEAFHDLVSQYPETPFFPFIHMIYSTTSSSETGRALYPEQTGYVTAAELLVDWDLKGLVEPERALRTAEDLVPRILKEDPTARGVYEFALPKFVHCDDFQWQWPVGERYEFLAPLRDHLAVRCDRQVSWGVIRR